MVHFVKDTLGLILIWKKALIGKTTIDYQVNLGLRYSFEGGGSIILRKG